MAIDPAALNPAALGFLAERHLATLTTLRPDGSPHVVAVGFTWDDASGIARVITDGGSRKAAHVRAGSRAVVAQVDGPRWISLEGPAEVSSDATRVADAVRRYAARYRVPRENPTRVVIEIRVDRVLGSSAMRSAV